VAARLWADREVIAASPRVKRQLLPITYHARNTLYPKALDSRHSTLPFYIAELAKV
jgi:hypothetical protein